MDIQKLAQLSRIRITDAEQTQYETEISSILKYVERVQQAVASEATPADREAAAVQNVFRDDANPHARGEYTDALLNEVPETHNGYVKVKKIL